MEIMASTRLPQPVRRRTIEINILWEERKRRETGRIAKSLLHVCLLSFSLGGKNLQEGKEYKYLSLNIHFICVTCFTGDNNGSGL